LRNELPVALLMALLKTQQAASFRIGSLLHFANTPGLSFEVQ
jgi:hypothetical protein